MKLLLLILLAVTCQAYTPITEQSWVTFCNITYKTAPEHDEPDIIHAKYINIRESLSALSTFIQKSVREYQKQMQKYTAAVTERIKQATTATADYGFIRKPELQHQYGMLFNHHGKVISRLKNMNLFLSIDLPKVEDIAHV